MPFYTVYPLIKPQYVASGAAAAVTFAPSGAGTTVPLLTNYMFSFIRVTNNGTTAGPVTLQGWLVPSGAAADAQHIVLPTISIPVGTNTFPHFDVGAYWGETLAPGDSIWMLAGNANSLNVWGSGAVIIP